MMGTIVSSFFSDRLVRLLGSGRITAISTAMTAVALFGFSISTEFWMLLLWSIPYGLGAGAVDAVLNNYVALHFKAQHMSWLHCFWGVGASISPYIMSFALVQLESWSRGYLIVSVVQITLAVLIFASIPLWKRCAGEGGADPGSSGAPLRLKEIIRIPGAVPCLFTFFSYCALELTSSLWATSYLVESHGVDEETASALASLFYLGLTVGRAVNGFLAMKYGDRFLIRLGAGIIAGGIVLLAIPVHAALAFVGFVVIGLGCAPIYPCIIHMTPDVFGRDRSQAMIGVQMAFAYIGFCVMPPLFGFLAERFSTALLPWYLLALLLLMVGMHELMVSVCRRKNEMEL
jgi:fucose permease